MSQNVKKFVKGKQYQQIVTVEKVRGEVPTVIVVSGRRYVYDPNN